MDTSFCTAAKAAEAEHIILLITDINTTTEHCTIIIDTTTAHSTTVPNTTTAHKTTITNINTTTVCAVSAPRTVSLALQSPVQGQNI